MATTTCVAILEALGVLAGGIAHDFNNLLTGMFGFVEMAREHATDAGAVEEHKGRAMAVFDKARGLTRQLLTFSKAGEPVREPVHLKDALPKPFTLADVDAVLARVLAKQR